MLKTNSKRRLRRNPKFRLFCIICNMIFVCVIVAGLAFGLIFSATKKNEYRDEGIEKYKAGEYLAAITSFDKSVEIKQLFSKKIDVDSLLYMADAYIRLEDYQGAYDTYQKLLTEYDKKYYDEEKVSFLLTLSDALDDYRNGEYYQCLDVFQEAIDRGYTEMSLYAALCCEKSDDYEGMKQYYSMYGNTHGMNSYLYYKIASSYILMKDFQNAIIYIDEGLIVDDKEYYQQLLYTQIMCNLELKQYEKALGYAETYIAAYPEDEDAMDLYEYLYSRIYPNENAVVEYEG